MWGDLIRTAKIVVRNRVLTLLIAVLLIVVVPLASFDRIETAQAIEIVILFGLVLVTATYAKGTSDIARAAKEQANTLRETLSMSVRPSLSFPYVHVQGDKSYAFEPPQELQFAVQNTGKGSARNLVIECESQDKRVEYSRIELPSLDVGSPRRCSIGRITPHSQGQTKVAYVLLKALYNDDVGESWVTMLQIDKDDDWKEGEITTNRL